MVHRVSIMSAMVVLVWAAPVLAQSASSLSGHVFLPAAPSSAEAPSQLDRLARARANLIALREGRLAIGALSPQDLQDVLDLDRMIRGDSVDRRSSRQKCVDREVERFAGRPSRLEWSVIELKCR